MTKKSWKALIEGGKELVRTGLIAAVPLIIDGLIADAVNVRLIGIAFAIAVLRAIDKGLHEKNFKSPLDLKVIDKFI